MIGGESVLHLNLWQPSYPGIRIRRLHEPPLRFYGLVAYEPPPLRAGGGGGVGTLGAAPAFGFVASSPL
jgi:hypothetical protein